MKTRRYDWKPDESDTRDFLYAPLFSTKSDLPEQTDLRKSCSPVENQGPVGSCTAQALAGALEFLEIKNKKELVDLSRLFIYYNERSMEGRTAQDAGATLRDGIKGLHKWGVCKESLWPYQQDLLFDKPSQAAYTEATGRRILRYERLRTLEDMRGILASGLPFVFGFKVYASFESQEVAQSGRVEMPQPGETFLGGHAVMAVGYNDVQQRLLVRNSWGPKWGMEGYFTMPYEYLTSSSLTGDFWLIRK